MKQHVILKWSLLLVALIMLSGCFFLPDFDSSPPPVKAFPSAEGFGAEAIGGRDGKVYIVTNLNDNGPGSLREAVEAKGARIIVFETSGIIELRSPLIIQNPFITIAGQTSPEGITLANYKLEIKNTHDVIIRHLRIRLGDLKANEVDAVEIIDSQDVILDHLSASWGIDETLSVRGSDRITVQWSIISEALNDSIHGKGAHGYGSLIRGSHGDSITFHHNLYAHNGGRNPRPGNYIHYNDDPIGLIFDFRNNVIYNWNGNEAGNNEDQNAISQYNFVNNYYKAGPNTNKSNAFKDNALYIQAYWSGNSMNGNVPSNQWSLVSGKGPTSNTYTKLTTEVPVAPVSTESASSAYNSVLAQVGAFPRDAIDDRVVNNVKDKKGKIINSQSEVVSNWPQKQSLKTAVLSINRTDTNRNGIPDWWEKENGVKNGNHRQIMNSGYTAIEEYINWVADQLLP